jgi:hypothetical protein
MRILPSKAIADSNVLKKLVKKSTLRISKMIKGDKLQGG